MNGITKLFVTLNGELVPSRNTLIATGSHPLIPRIEGLEETGYLTNEDIFDLTHLPVVKKLPTGHHALLINSII